MDFLSEGSIYGNYADECIGLRPLRGEWGLALLGPEGWARSGAGPLRRRRWAAASGTSTLILSLQGIRGVVLRDVVPLAKAVFNRYQVKRLCLLFRAVKAASPRPRSTADWTRRATCLAASDPPVAGVTKTSPWVLPPEASQSLPSATAADTTEPVNIMLSSFPCLFIQLPASIAAFNSCLS